MASGRIHSLVVSTFPVRQSACGKLQWFANSTVLVGSLRSRLGDNSIESVPAKSDLQFDIPAVDQEFGDQERQQELLAATEFPSAE